MAIEKTIICDLQAFWQGGGPCVLWGASPDDDGSALAPFLRKPHFLIAADGGQASAARHGLVPDLLVGDMDSGGNTAKAAKSLLLPAEKDDTDMMAAAREGLKRGYRRFLLTGCTGGRLDHFLAAFSVLALLAENEALGAIVAGGNQIFWAEGPCKALLPAGEFLYFSLQPMDETVENVSITGAKYPLSQHTLRRTESIGISNEITAEQAVVSAAAGAFLIIRSGI